MKDELGERRLLLILDTCGERASIALFSAAGFLGQSVLEERTASSALLPALRSLLATHDAGLADVSALGVVSGPGSFTGVRVGLAVAKGFCEATGAGFAAVSRLEVLAETAGIGAGFALLPAGRGQVYVRVIGGDHDGREWMAAMADLPLTAETQVAVTSPELAVELAGRCSVQQVELSARHAYPAVSRSLAAGGSDVAAADANYVRNEDAIYRKNAAERGLHAE